MRVPVGTWICVLLTASLAGAASAEKPKGQLSLVQVAADDSPAIVQITYWGEDGQNPAAFTVVGTGFLVGRGGYFVTAAHVLEHYKSNSGQLSATLHQRDKNGSGRWFDVVERDSEHDLALCKLVAFQTQKEGPPGPRPPSTFVPAASLAISEGPPEVGELFAMIGYPLGSFASPIVQFGNVAATDAILDAVPNFPAGRHELLIVSVAGNHGNSGCPIISLESGAVLGVIIQYVPAPLLSMTDGRTQQNVPQQSGLMVAVPAKWVLQLLARHGIANAPISPKEKLVM